MKITYKNRVILDKREHENTVLGKMHRKKGQRESNEPKLITAECTWVEDNISKFCTFPWYTKFVQLVIILILQNTYVGVCCYKR